MQALQGGGGRSIQIQVLVPFRSNNENSVHILENDLGTNELRYCYVDKFERKRKGYYMRNFIRVFTKSETPSKSLKVLEVTEECLNVLLRSLNIVFFMYDKAVWNSLNLLFERQLRHLF